MTENIMRLDKLNEIHKAPGEYRPLCEEDLFYIPYWEKSFAEECGVEAFNIPLMLSV